MGGSVTGGGGVSDNVTRAWPALLGFPTTIHYKNAIEPSYFLHCPERFSAMRGPYRAVVLDFGPNMWSTDAPRHLASLVYIAAQLSNASRVGLVAWPRRRHLSDVKRIQEVARATGAFAIAFPVNNSLYSDDVHPNAHGHALIADHVKEFLLSPALGEVSPRGSMTNRDEMCFPDARKMPIVENTGWRLVDGGRATRAKFGWAPQEIGGVLELKLSVPAAHCGAIVTLSYLRTPENGDLHIRCDCQCRPIRGYHQRHVHPFPHVRTRIVGSLRVTDTTSFTMLANESRACHVLLSGQKTRVDSVYVRDAHKDDVTNARVSTHPLDRQFATRALQRCS